MARHFLQIYVLIVLTLAAASWGQEHLWQEYGRHGAAQATADDQPQVATLAIVGQQLHAIPRAARPKFVADLAAKTGVDLELFESGDIAGETTLASLARGEVAFMRAANGQAWILQQLQDEGRVLAFRYSVREPQRSLLDWILAFIFYAAIALVLMMWLWPLTRDLRTLERATASFGNRNWKFDAVIKPSSQIYPLAEAFNRMAARIDALVSSQKDMTNALSHEIKTPLSRMRFELEMARTEEDPLKLAERLDHVETDIAELNAFVTATLEYAILERAEVALNMGEHDFTLILPALAESIRTSARADLEIRCEVQGNANRVACDAHLMEAVFRNLLYNAMRFAKSRVRVTFRIRPGGTYRLQVDDDGPGIPHADRQRVFGSFVQLSEPGSEKVGFGLGLAIVKRIVGWHGGSVAVEDSELGGAAFLIDWPSSSIPGQR